MLKAKKELVNLIISEFNIGVSYDLLSRWDVWSLFADIVIIRALF